MNLMAIIAYMYSVNFEKISEYSNYSMKLGFLYDYQVKFWNVLLQSHSQIKSLLHQTYRSLVCFQLIHLVLVMVWLGGPMVLWVWDTAMQVSHRLDALLHDWILIVCANSNKISFICIFSFICLNSQAHYVLHLHFSCSWTEIS